MTIAACFLLPLPLPCRPNSDKTQICGSYKIVKKTHEDMTISVCFLVVVFLPCRPDSDNIRICEMYKNANNTEGTSDFHVYCLRLACFGLLLACFVWRASCFFVAVLLHRRGGFCTSGLHCLACFWLAQSGLCCLGLACCARVVATKSSMFDRTA